MALPLCIALISIAHLIINFCIRNNPSILRKIFVISAWTKVLICTISLIHPISFQYTLHLSQIPSLHFAYSNIGNLFIALTTFIFSLVAMEIKATEYKQDTAKYINLLLLIEMALMGCFCAKDLLSFFISFEFSILPVFFIILFWGGANKVLAAKQFLTYTILGSSLILIPIAYLCVKTGTCTPDELMINASFANIPHGIKCTLLFMMVMGFFVKIPTFPFHTWLPLAHVQAPTGGSMILAGILIKLGGFGIIVYLIPIFREQINQFKDIFTSFGLISLIYGSIAAMGQSDIKKIIAYSSIAHMSYVVCGIFSMNETGMNAAIFQMISHGIVSSGLFYMIGIAYSRFHTREIKDYGNIYNCNRFYAQVFILLTMASIGLPGTMGFVGELLAIMSLKHNVMFTLILASGTLLGASYMLNLTRRFLFSNGNTKDLTFQLEIKEKINLTILGLSVIVFGIYPKLIFTNIM